MQANRICVCRVTEELHILSDNTSYASATCLNMRSDSILLFGFLSGCHFNANL